MKFKMFTQIEVTRLDCDICKKNVNYSIDSSYYKCSIYIATAVLNLLIIYLNCTLI